MGPLKGNRHGFSRVSVFTRFFELINKMGAQGKKKRSRLKVYFDEGNDAD